MKRVTTNTGRSGEGALAAMSLFAILGMLAGYCAFGDMIPIVAAGILGALTGLGMSGGDN
jgi:hypothetical protein